MTPATAPTRRHYLRRPDNHATRPAPHRPTGTPPRSAHRAVGTRKKVIHDAQRTTTHPRRRRTAAAEDFGLRRAPGGPVAGLAPLLLRWRSPARRHGPACGHDAGRLGVPTLRLWPHEHRVAATAWAGQPPTGLASDAG